MSDTTWVCHNCGSSDISSVEHGIAWGHLDIYDDGQGGFNYDWPFGINEGNVEWETRAFICETCQYQTPFLDNLVVRQEQFIPPAAELAYLLGNL